MNATDVSRRSSTSMNRSPQVSRVHERRRSAVPMNINLNDPTLPGPGELSSSDHRSSIGSAYRTHSPTSIGGNPAIATGDPHHQRAPSLGEIHQELEQEQEAQVNRLLQMIRIQQAQLQQQQRQQQQQGGATSGTAIADDSTPTSERSISFPTIPPLPMPGHRSSAQFNLSRRRSSGHATSPHLPPMLSQQTESEPIIFTPEWATLGGDGAGRRGSRDETSYYQAETATLTRENQMLRHRIRELERQISEMSSSTAHAPTTRSNLATEEESVPPTPQPQSESQSQSQSEPQTQSQPVAATAGGGEAEKA
ncbi:hypothetical protein FQN50_002883 [Emmonsiellopsis sp. PD_5]|nr:hypothetical protein FQN50_002883 [Emmonsiellopsis sp. PD_5]